MNQTSKTVIFFGSGPVATLSLELLLEHTNVEAVVTKSSTYREMSEVAQDIPVHAANKRSELDELLSQQTFESQLGVVIDYGVIISADSIAKFELGIINSHFSILPEWQGADPITFSLLSGQKNTGVSLMLIDETLDTGDILATASCEILPTFDNQTLTDKLINLSNELLKTNIPLYLNGSLQPTRQPDKVITYSQMLKKEDGIIDFKKTATELERQIRAFSGWPSSRVNYNGHWLTITSATASSEKIEPGKMLIKNKSLYLGCRDTSLQILQIQPAGKKNMDSIAFINGYALALKIEKG